MLLRPFYVMLMLLTTACTGFSGTAGAPGSTPGRSEWLAAWLASPTCAPPCWEGISPGKTSATTALEILARLPYRAEANQGVDGTITADLAKNSQALLTTSQDKIHFITLDLSRAEQLTLSEVIRAYDEPSEVVLYSCNDGICEVELHWNTRGLIVVSVVPDVRTQAFRVKIDPYASIGTIVMVESTSQWLRDYPRNVAPPAPWHGYGGYP